MAAMTINKENFDAEVLHSEKPVLLNFWATWCGPCRMVAPILDEISEELEEAKIGRINVDEEGDLADAYGVLSIPTLMLLRDGKVTLQTVGFSDKDAILAMLSGE